MEDKLILLTLPNPSEFIKFSYVYFTAIEVLTDNSANSFQKYKTITN